MLRRLIFILIFVGWGITACGGDDEDKGSDTNDRDTQAISATPTLPFSVDLVLWHSYDDQRAVALTDAVRDFNNAYEGSVSVALAYHSPENIRSDYEQAIRDGEGPDILVIEHRWLAEFVEQRLIYAIDETQINTMRSDLPEAVFPSFSYSDLVWAVPLWADMLVLYTNAALVDEAPTTIDGLVAASQSQPFILYPGTEGIAGLYNDGTGTFIVSEDGNLILLKVNLVSFLKVYQQLVSAPGITFSDDPAAFMEGEAGGLVGFASDFEMLQSILGDNLQVSPLPTNDDANWETFAYFTPLVISANSPETNINATSLFFAYLLTKNVQIEMATTAQRVPVISETNTQSDRVFTIGIDQLQSAHTMSPYPLFYDIVLPEMDAILSQVTSSMTDDELAQLADQFFTNIQQ